MNPFSDRKRGIWRARKVARVDSPWKNAMHSWVSCTHEYGTGNAWISHVSQDCSIFPGLEWCTLFLARLVWKKALGIGNVESYSLSLSLSLLSPPLFSALLLLDSRVFPLIKRKLFPSSSLFSHARSCFARNTFPRSLPETERDRRPFSWN